ncbi:MAG: hypothetical protein WAQ98_01890, partial [Blastocatellia bacterium]
MSRNFNKLTTSLAIIFSLIFLQIPIFAQNPNINNQRPNTSTDNRNYYGSYDRDYDRGYREGYK